MQGSLAKTDFKKGNNPCFENLFPCYDRKNSLLFLRRELPTNVLNFRRYSL
jgi:hypothetical protein